jgi:hypothetical protein
MQVLLYAAVSAAILSASCSTVNKETPQSIGRKTTGARIAAFTKHVSSTVADMASDTLPIVTAASNELLLETKSDLRQASQEFRSQMAYLSPLRKSRQAGP